MTSKATDCGLCDEAQYPHTPMPLFAVLIQRGTDLSVTGSGGIDTRPIEGIPPCKALSV